MESKWVFGLSLDEKIEWCLAKIVRFGSKPDDIDVSERRQDRITGVISSEIADRYKGKFQELVLRPELLRIRESHKEIIGNVSSVGVSVVGLADREKLQLVSIARKDWGVPGRTPVIDFRELFDDIFPDVPVKVKKPKINIHNESTAKCLAEWRRLTPADEVFSLFYVMFSEGVNGGYVDRGRPLSTELHTELGHIWPRPHRIDYFFDTENTGCRIHKYCFEGLAAARRIRKTWGGGTNKHLSQLGEEAWDVISFYVAQMCMNGVLAVSPGRILLGGETLFPELLEDITNYFIAFNSGGGDEPYLRYDALNRDGFIRMASIPPNEAGVAAALELARFVIAHGGAALQTTLPFLRKKHSQT